MAKAHTNERPKGPVPKGKQFVKSTGPNMTNEGPVGSKLQNRPNIINTLAGRQMNGIGKIKGTRAAS